MQSSTSLGLESNTNTITFRRGNVKTIDIWEIESLQDLPIIGRTPLLYRRGDNVEIQYIGSNNNTRNYNKEKERHTRLHKTFTKLNVSHEDRKGFIKDILSWTPAEILSNARSLDLLSEWVTKKELQYWEKHGEITIQSPSKSDRKYVITKERLDRTWVIIDGRLDHTLCVQSTENYDLPYGDALLSKIVALKSNEEYFILHSNKFHVTTTEKQEYERRHPIPANYRPRSPVNTISSTQSRIRSGMGACLSGATEGRLGMFGGVYEGFTQIDTQALEGAVQQYTQAQALLDGIAPDQEGIVVRDIAGETPPTPQRRRQRQTDESVWDLGHQINPAGLDGGGEARLRLQSRSEGIDIQRLGHISPLPFQTQINPVYINQCVRFVAAQGLFDMISTVEEGMAIRSLLPDLDFRFGINDQAVFSREWIQPANSQGFLPNETRSLIYQTNMNSNNTRKVILLYGIANLLSRPGNIQRNLANSLIIQRSTVRIIDIIDLSYSANVSFIPFRQPIMFKRGDNMNLYLDLKTEAVGQSSHYMLLGLVAEPLGAQLTG